MQKIEKKLKPQLIKNFIQALIIFIFLLPFWYMFLQHIYFNPSMSEPVGYYFVYKANNYKVGDIVLLCVSDIASINLLHKFGLPYEKDNCVMDTPYLLKTLVAGPNDLINITNSGIYVNSRLINDSALLNEVRGIKLNPLAFATFKLKKNQYFAIGNNPYSYDSRYFGVVEKRQIKFKAYNIWKIKIR